MLQSLAGWCLSYCRDQDSKDLALASVITTAHTSTRLDLETGPAKGIQHQVWEPLFHHDIASVLHHACQGHVCPHAIQVKSAQERLCT